MSFLGASESFQGDLSFEGDFSIFGKFNGKIQSDTGSLFIKEGALFQGHVNVRSLLVFGTFTGSVVCDTVELKDSSLTEATIKCNFIKVHKGAKFYGSFKMSQQNPLPDLPQN